MVTGARAARRRWAPGRAPSGVVPAVVVAVVGALVSLGMGGVLRESQVRTAEEMMRHRSGLTAEAVTAEANRYVDTVRTVATGVAAFDTLTAVKFAELARPLRAMRLAGATAMAFMAPAAGEEVPVLQDLWRGRGVPDLTLDPKGTGPEHIFSIFSEPLDGASPATPGVDATQSPAATQALNEARRADLVTVSDTYQLIADRALPPERQQSSFMLAAPVYVTGAGGPRAFRGWVVMALRGQDFIGATLGQVTGHELDVTLRASNADGTLTTVATLTRGSTRPNDLHHVVEISVAQRRWELRLDAAASNLPLPGSLMPTAMTGAALTVTAILTALVFVLVTGRARARAQVAAATVDLRHAETEARRQAGLLTAILDSVSDGVDVIDDKGDLVFHNPAARAMLGVAHATSATVDRQQHYGIFTPDGMAAFPSRDLPIVRALAGESTDQVPMMIRNAGHPQGLIMSVSARPLDPTAGQPGAVAVFHDITARTRADAELGRATSALRDELARRRAVEADLAAQKDYLAQVLDAIDVTVVTCDTAGEIVHANRVARSVLPAPAMPTNVGSAAPQVQIAHLDGTPMQVSDTPLMRALRGEEVDGVEATVVRPDGTERSIMLHARPLRHADNTIVGAVGSSYDFTALHEREAELVAFAGLVAHDLKSPLAIILGFTTMARDSLADDGSHAEQRDDLERVLSTTDRMARLIDDLLAYAAARDSTLTKVDVDLGALVDDVLADRLTEATVDPTTPAPQVYVAPLPDVSADASLVRQLIDNLIGNAIKYTAPGKPARIDITGRPAAAGQVQIEIADRGIGIPAGQHHAIFTGFHRAHTTADYTGTGLGLAICYRVVHRHGGTITADDNPGGGTRFRFTLPAGAPHTGQATRRRAASAPR